MLHNMKVNATAGEFSVMIDFFPRGSALPERRAEQMRESRKQCHA